MRRAKGMSATGGRTAVLIRGRLVGVLTTEPLGRVLDYKAPEGGCGTGDFVEVPLGPRRVLGVVWGPGEGKWDPAKVRPVNRVLDAAPMRDELRQFLSRTADYTLTPLPAMLRLATRTPGLADPPSMRTVYRLTGTVPNSLTDARHRVVEALRAFNGAAVTLGELTEAAACGSSRRQGPGQTRRRLRRGGAQGSTLSNPLAPPP